MKVALINIPIEAPWLGKGAWITVPPQGYGGIQWVVATLIDGLLDLGHEVFLLGAPGSVTANDAFRVVDAGSAEAMSSWLQENPMDIVHDSSNGVVPLNGAFKHVSTHHLTGRPVIATNAVYLSHAQREQARATMDAPVVRIPVNPERFLFSSEKSDYLLFLGRISPWKGALEAAAFAQAADLPLLLAGPAWESDYLEEILRLYGETVQLVGEVKGAERLKLLAEARALLVLSQPIPGPWGDQWSEPGATVVSEAAVSGTPVIATENGCLAEIVPKVGCVLSSTEPVTEAYAKQILESLPLPETVRAAAIREWGYVKIAQEYEALYKEVIGGKQWS
jgi:glycosyltransferase involved in cell wall biosynthesis